MYCAGCGQFLTNGQTVCSNCGRRQSSPAEAAQAYEFARTIRRLSRFWLLFAALNLALGAVGLIMLSAGLWNHAGPYEPWPHPPLLAWTFVGASAWVLVTIRALMAAFAGMALRDQADCARPVALTAAVVALTQFPIGLLLGSYTVAKLAGRRNAASFARLG